MSELQRMLDEAFIEEGDRNRLARIEGLLRAGAPLRVAVHPGEPEYHVFIQDPDDMDAPLFAFVLAPEAVISEMLAEPPRLVFETATFQAMGNDTSPQAFRHAFESWVRRMWPGLEVPPVQLRQWPVEDAHSL